MAIKTNFQIPVEFTFKLRSLKWFSTTARIDGWWDDDWTDPGLTTVHPPCLKATVESGSLSGHSFQVPDRLWPKNVWEATENYDTLPSSDALATLLSDVRLDVFTFDRHKAQDAKPQLKDAWEMREDFLKPKRSKEDYFEFLQKWGEWRGAWGDDPLVMLTELEKSHEEIRAALTKANPKWLGNIGSYLSIYPRFASGYPFHRIEETNCQSAIQATVTIDLLQAIKFSICARRDCATPFARTGRRDKVYCSNYCAHLMSVRRQAAHKAAKKARP